MAPERLAPPVANPPASSDSEEEEEEEESNSSLPPQPHQHLPLKKLFPQSDENEEDQTHLNPATIPNLPALKRKRNGSDERVNKDEETAKKQLFQRVWSEEDEITILKGMVDYYGSNPTADKNGFNNFIRKSVDLKFTEKQMSDKLNRLKKKYKSNSKKEAEGKDMNFTNPNKKRAYDLSKMIWGTNMKAEDGGSASVHVNPGDLKSSNVKGKSLALEEGSTLFESSMRNEAVDREFLYFHYSSNSKMSNCEERMMKKGLLLLDGAQAKMLEERWKELEWNEMDLIRKRSILMNDQRELTYDTLSSSR